MTERFEVLKYKLPIDEFLKVLWEESDMKGYCSEESFMFLQNIASRYRDMEPKDALDSFINEFTLLTPADVFNPGADAVTLMTLHMAKGLEFRVIFIAGVEDGIIPYTMNKGDIDIEEERRLFYVGMTRAMDELFLLHARNRFLYGRRLLQSPSPFLREIPEESVRSIFVPDRVKKGKKERQTGLF